MLKIDIIILLLGSFEDMADIKVNIDENPILLNTTFNINKAWFLTGFPNKKVKKKIQKTIL